MENDDQHVGKILTRREVLALMGATGVSFLLGCSSPDADSSAATAETSALAPESATAANPTSQAEVAAGVATAEAAAVPSCVVRPEVAAGPYYVNLDLLRSDIREDRAGLPLALTFNVVEVKEDGCTPMQGALVEIWHCDADGVYSGVSDPGFDTSGPTWLRGAQTTDAAGAASFTTIYPGWYPGRCVHIHFKVRPTSQLDFTSQLFFPDAFTAQVLTREPYAERGQPDTVNSRDFIYQDMLRLDPATQNAGYAAVFPIGIDLSTVGSG